MYKTHPGNKRVPFCIDKIQLLIGIDTCRNASVGTGHLIIFPALSQPFKHVQTTSHLGGSEVFFFWSKRIREVEEHRDSAKKQPKERRATWFVNVGLAWACLFLRLPLFRGGLNGN